MSKDEILSLLEEKRGEILSGNDLKEALGISRNAVWKAINLLKEEGHTIESVKNKGYRLNQESDVLSVRGLTHALGEEHPYLLEVLEEIPSTNSYLKESTEKKNNTAVFAKRQLQGRGRLGKSFFSEDAGGLYFSLLKKEDLANYDASLTTIACALAVRETLAFCTGLPVSIKWVNDLYIHGKKVAGILTEGTLEMETGMLSSLIIGIGINVNTPTFPQELSDIATSLVLETGKTYLRCDIAARILQSLESYLLQTKKDPEGLVAEYKRHMLYLGEEITFLYQSNPTSGILLDLTREGHLVVDVNGTLLTLHSGEISIKQRRPSES